MHTTEETDFYLDYSMQYFARVMNKLQYEPCLANYLKYLFCLAISLLSVSSPRPFIGCKCCFIKITILFLARIAICPLDENF